MVTANVPALGEVANFGTDYFLLKIIFLARNKRVFTTKFAILPNACWWQFLFLYSCLFVLGNVVKLFSIFSIVKNGLNKTVNK
jgi:hypothetical protein